VHEQQVDVVDTQPLGAALERLPRTVTLCQRRLNFVVTNSSSRGTPVARRPRPTPRSFS
jgi:hypothetical protein